MSSLERGRIVGPPATALALAIPLVALYLAIAPPAADLAAATYRSDLFARVGFTTWDTGWYAAHGHWLPGYSLLSPALGALLGVRLLLALSALAAAVLFALIAERSFGKAGCGACERRREVSAATAAAVVFVLGFSAGMLSGRVPYDIGLAIGLGAVLAFMHGHTLTALALAALTSLASPVAGAFLALVGLAAVAASPHASGHGSAPKGLARARNALAPVDRRGLMLALAALCPIVALGIAYPEGGYEPFAPSAFWPALSGVLLFAAAVQLAASPLRAQTVRSPADRPLAPHVPPGRRGHRALTSGAALYALALASAYAIRTPMGGNAARLGPLLAAPLLVGLMWERRRGALLALAPLLLYWQLVTPIRDEIRIAGDPSVHASYYAPLRAELRRLSASRASAVAGAAERRVGPARDRAFPASARTTIVEVPLTSAHWEAAYLAGAPLPGRGRVALARGWERQLDTRYAALFYSSTLTASAYRTWLERNRVEYVALPDAPLDRAGRLEGRLIAHERPPYLRPIWRSRHWELYRLIG